MTGRERGAEELLLISRLGDALEKCRRGEVAALSFLTPRERRLIERELLQTGNLDAACFWGGYAGAERTALFLLPDYLVQVLDTPPSACDTNALRDLVGEVWDEQVCAVRVVGSGYRTLTHRDYLGSVLGLGLERDAIGDVAVQNEREAVIFTSRRIADFLSAELSKVASDTVRCSRYEIDAHFTDGRQYQPISDTVASERLDCVVAALTNLSRENAKSLIQSGLVEVEYEVEDRADAALVPPLSLSIRGYGRFILRAFDGETKKGRLRLRAQKLI